MSIQKFDAIHNLPNNSPVIPTHRLPTPPALAYNQIRWI